MAVWEKQIGAINLIVGDLERSSAFYRQVFGLPVQHEDEDTAMFRFKDTYVFLQRGPAHQDEPSGEAFKLAGERGWAVRHHRFGRGCGAGRVGSTRRDADQRPGRP